MVHTVAPSGKGQFMTVADIASIVTAVGVFFAVIGLFAQTRQRKFGLAELYIQRYWQIDDAMKLAVAEGKSDAVDQARYLVLCEDEYEVAQLGWIDANVWTAWHEAIVNGTRSAVLPEDGFRLLKACRNGQPHKPYQCPGLGAVRRGRRFFWWIERRTGG